jgi:hypothetical protein
MNRELNVSHPGHGRHDTTPRTTPAVFAAIGVVLVCAFAATYSYGRTALTAAANSDAIAIETENRTFCAELGLVPQSDVYGKCTFGLTEVRRRSEQRVGARAAGIL